MGGGCQTPALRALLRERGDSRAGTSETMSTGEQEGQRRTWSQAERGRAAAVQRACGAQRAASRAVFWVQSSTSGRNACYVAVLCW